MCKEKKNEKKIFILEYIFSLASYRYSNECNHILFDLVAKK